MQHTLSGEAKKTSGSTWLIYGATGVGKTPLASCFPHPWYWDFEAGVKSMLRDDIVVTKPESYGDTLALVQLVQQFKPGELMHLTGREPFKFCSLVVDTAGEMGRVFEKSAKGSKEQGSIQEWYLVVERMRNIARQLRNEAAKGLNICFLTHEQYMKQGEIEVVQGLPDLPGKELPIDFPKLFDVVAHLQVRQGAQGLERWLTAEPHTYFIGRDRRGILKSEKIDLATGAAALEQFLVTKGGMIHSCKA